MNVSTSVHSSALHTFMQTTPLNEAVTEPAKFNVVGDTLKAKKVKIN